MLSVLCSSHPEDRAQPTSLPRPTPAHRAGQARQRFVDEQEGKMIAGNGITGRSSLLDWDQIFTLLIIKPGVSLAFSTLFIPPCLQWQTQSAWSRCRLNTCFRCLLSVCPQGICCVILVPQGTLVLCSAFLVWLQVQLEFQSSLSRPSSFGMN